MSLASKIKFIAKRKKNVSRKSQMYCLENKQAFNKIEVIMHMQLFENIGAGTPATNGQFFLGVYSNT